MNKKIIPISLLFMSAITIGVATNCQTMASASASNGENIPVTMYGTNGNDYAIYGEQKLRIDDIVAIEAFDEIGRYSYHNSFCDIEYASISLYQSSGAGNRVSEYVKTIKHNNPIISFVDINYFITPNKDDQFYQLDYGDYQAIVKTQDLYNMDGGLTTDEWNDGKLTPLKGKQYEKFVFRTDILLYRPTLTFNYENNLEFKIDIIAQYSFFTFNVEKYDTLGIQRIFANKCGPYFLNDEVPNDYVVALNYKEFLPQNVANKQKNTLQTDVLRINNVVLDTNISNPHHINSEMDNYFYQYDGGMFFYAINADESSWHGRKQQKELNGENWRELIQIVAEYAVDELLGFFDDEPLVKMLSEVYSGYHLFRDLNYVLSNIEPKEEYLTERQIFDFNNITKQSVSRKFLVKDENGPGFLPKNLLLGPLDDLYKKEAGLSDNYIFSLDLVNSVENDKKPGDQFIINHKIISVATVEDASEWDTIFTTNFIFNVSYDLEKNIKSYKNLGVSKVSKVETKIQKNIPELTDSFSTTEEYPYTFVNGGSKLVSYNPKSSGSYQLFVKATDKDPSNILVRGYSSDGEDVRVPFTLNLKNVKDGCFVFDFYGMKGWKYYFEISNIYVENQTDDSEHDVHIRNFDFNAKVLSGDSAAKTHHSVSNTGMVSGKFIKDVAQIVDYECTTETKLVMFDFNTKIRYRVYKNGEEICKEDNLSYYFLTNPEKGVSYKIVLNPLADSNALITYNVQSSYSLDKLNDCTPSTFNNQYFNSVDIGYTKGVFRVHFSTIVTYYVIDSAGKVYLSGSGSFFDMASLGYSRKFKVVFKQTGIAKKITVRISKIGTSIC